MPDEQRAWLEHLRDNETAAEIEAMARAADPVGWRWFDNADADHPAKPPFIECELRNMRDARCALFDTILRGE